jgi:hypothetical protein
MPLYLCSNHGEPNSYLLRLLGIGAAWLVTVALRTVMNVAKGAQWYAERHEDFAPLLTGYADLFRLQDCARTIQEDR